MNGNLQNKTNKLTTNYNKRKNMNINEKYTSYIRGLVLSGMSKEDILSSSSDEKIIYSSYYPEDSNLDEFEAVTKKILEKLTKIVFQDDLKRHRIEYLINEWKDFQHLDLLIMKFNEVVVSGFHSKQEIYIKNIYLVTQFVALLNAAGYSNYYNELNDGGYIININL